MANEANDDTKNEQLTPEQRDQQSAERYRAQLGGAVEDESKDDQKDDQGADKGDKAADQKEGDDKLSIDDKPQRPAHIPEKFWDAEKGEVRVDEMAKSYAELEKLKSKGGEKPADGESGTENGEKEGEGKEGEKPDAYAEGVKAFQDLRAEMDAKLVAGEPLTDEMYARAEKHGFNRDDVDAFIAGQQAIGQLARMEVHAEVGGEETYKAMIEWARANYTKGEVAVYDRDIHSNDPEVRKAAARGLAARYAQANGRDGRSVTDGTGHKSTQGYTSGGQMKADMADPRYAKDAAFREEVARKIAAARAAGVDLFAS